jgi:CRP/FNR family cyclic AMP-dependent transcriptional regulator
VHTLGDFTGSPLLFNSSEKRLARALLLLARYGEEAKPQRVLPKVSQEMLAEMVGTTRSRVNFS